MQISNAMVTEAKSGDYIDIRVTDRVGRGDKVYKDTE